MKMKYEEILVNLVTFNAQDVLTTSGGFNGEDHELEGPKNTDPADFVR